MYADFSTSSFCNNYGVNLYSYIHTYKDCKTLFCCSITIMTYYLNDKQIDTNRHSRFKWLNGTTCGIILVDFSCRYVCV